MLGRKITVEENMRSQTMINSKDKRFGPKELYLINPVSQGTASLSRPKILQMWWVLRVLSVLQGSLLEGDEDGAHAGDIFGLFAGFGIEVTQLDHPLSLSAWGRLINVVYKGFCCCTVVCFCFLKLLILA
jgi:hypothetical protein